MNQVEDALSPDSLSTHEEELAALLAKVHLADKEGGATLEVDRFEALNVSA